MKKKHCLKTAFLPAALLAVMNASAQTTYYWDSNSTTAGFGNTSGTWGTSTFWGTSAAGTGSTANTTITSVDTVNFGTASLNYANATIGVASGGVTVGDIVIGAGQTTAITALGTAGNAITIHNGITKNSGSAAVTITSPITLGGAQTWTNNSTGTLKSSGGLNLAGNLLTIAGTGTTDFSATSNFITGAGGLTKNDSGLLILGAGGTAPGHNYSGATTINGGTVRFISNASANSNITINNGVYEDYWTATFTRTLGSAAGQIQILGGTSGFSENGNTGMTVRLNNNAAFEVVWGSTFFNPSTLVLQTVTSQNGSSLTFDNKIDLNGSNRTITNDATGTATATIAQAIRTSTGTAGLVKTGVGQILLSNASNTYNGGTTVNQGTLTATVTGALPGYATPGNVVIAANATIGVRTGAWTAGNIDSLRGAATWSANTSRLGLDTTAGAFTYSSNITEALTLVKLNGNNLTLTGASTYTGKTLTNGGGILVGSIGNIGLTSSPLGVNNTFIDFIGSTGELEYNGAGETSNRLIDISGTAGTIRTTSNTGALVLSGAVNPTGTGTKTLTLLGTSTLNNTVSGNISNGAGGTLGVTKNLTGTWILSGSNSYTGATTLSGGKLVLAGSSALPSGSTLTWGTTGTTLQFQNNANLTLTNTLSTSNRNTTRTLVVDRLTAGSAVNLTFNAVPNIDNNSVFNFQKGANITSGTPTIRFNAGTGSSDSNNATFAGGTDFGPITFNPTGVNLEINGISSSARTRAYIFQGDADGNLVSGTFANGSGTAVRKSGLGTWTFNGTSQYTGTTQVTAGTLKFGRQTALYNNTPASWTAANINVQSGATLAFNVGGASEFTTGNVTTLLTNLASSGSATTGMNAGSNYGFDTTNASGGTFTIADVIADSTGASGGARGLTKLGTGELVLTNTNTHTGTTTVKAGTLTLGHATDTLANAPVTVDGSGATLAIGANSDTVGVVTLKNGSITGSGGTLTGSSYAVESGSVSAILGGSGNLSKTTSGTVILSGNNAYTGSTLVSDGTLQLSGAAAAIASSSGVDLGGGALLISNTSALNNTDRLNDSGTVTLSGSGVLNFSHTGGAANYSETTGALSVTGSGNQIITSRADSGQTSTLTFASLTLGGGLQFTGDALGLDSRNRIFITAQTAGPIGGSATYFDPLNNVTTPAAYTLLNGVGPQAADVDVDVLGGVIPDGSAAVSIIQAGTSGNITLGSTITSMDSLTQTATQAGTIELAGEILRTDLVIIGNPNAPLTIGTTPGEGTITPSTVSGSLTLNNNYAAPLLVINSVIANNGSGSSLLKTGAGTVQITAGATYTGGTVIGAGTVTLTGAGALPDTSAVDLSDPSSVLHLSGISASAETIGSLTGVSGSSVVIGGKTLALNGASPAPFAGGISGSGGGLTLLAGATQELTGDNTFTGDVTIGANASLSVNKIQTSGAQPLGQGTSSIVMQGNIGSGSTLTYTGAGAGATNRGLSLTGGQGGTVNVTAGTLTVNGTLTGSANFHKAGAATMVLAGGASWNANGFVNDGTLVLGADSSPGSNSLSGGNWTVATGATMRLNTTGALETPTLTRNGTFNLEAGTLRTNAIAGSGAFVWGAGTISPLSNLTEGSTDRTDPGGSPSGPVVREGTILDYSGNLATSNGSTLDLGGLFTDNGLRYNQINVSGSLSLSATDELKINMNPYLLRPNTYTSTITGDWGTLRLVVADSITGTFDALTGIGTDYLGFAADPGSGGTDSFINPASLAMNTYYIEYRTSGVLSGAAVLFHYKVAGSVPEPGSAGLLLGGALLLRAIRRRGNAPSAPLRLRLSRTRRRMNRRRRFAG
jgi:fibronectin-binding autotransporter adhesin